MPLNSNSEKNQRAWDLILDVNFNMYKKTDKTGHDTYFLMLVE